MPAPPQGLESFVATWWPGFSHRIHALHWPDVLLLAALLVLIRASSRLGMWAYALAAWPGTFAHESTHFLVAWLLRAQPAFPVLLPRRTEHGWRLGSVSFRAGRLRSLPIALAPLLLAPLAVLWALWLLPGAHGPLYVLQAWIAAALCSACLPSRTDLRVALPGSLFLAAVALLAGLIWLALK